MDAFAAATAAVQAQRVSNTEAVDRAERYFFFAGDEPGVGGPGGMSVGTYCIPNKTIFRCEVTPCLTVPRPSRPEEIPDGMRIAGSYDEKTKKMQYWLYSGPEAQVLLTEYANPGDYTKQWGLVELTALRGKSLDEVAALQITRVFFPSWPSLPETNTEVQEAIRSKLEDIETNPKIPAEIRPLYLSCGKQMLLASEQAQSHQSRIVSDSNMRVTLPNTDDKFKRDFDAKDHLFAKRTGLSLAMNSLRGNQTDVLAKVIDKIGQPVDTAMIGAIVAATVAALDERKEEAKTDKKK